MVFLLFFLPAIFCDASQEANDTAKKILKQYGYALIKPNINELNSLLDAKYEFYPCGKPLKPLNRENIIETVKSMPQKMIKLSNRTLIDAVFSNDEKSLRMKVNLGEFTITVIEAKWKNNGWVIYYEQQNACKGKHHLAATYMIDYNETAYHTSRELLRTLVGWTRSTKGKLLIDVMQFPFHLSYYHKESNSTLQTLTLSIENVKENRDVYDKTILQGLVRVVDAVLWSNRSLTFRTNSGRFNHQSFFIASPFDFNLSGVKWERYLLTDQFIEEPLDVDPVSLKFQQIQYWNIEKGEREE